MSEDHTVSVISKQVWHGEFDPSFLVDEDLPDSAMELQFEDETVLKFECSCGEKFRKRKTVTQHMTEVANE